MKKYKVSSTNALNFILISDNSKIGELIYEQWFAFKADIHLSDGEELKLEPKGFWNSKIELKDKSKTLLEFKMGWNGILIDTFFKPSDQSYLLQFKGLLNNRIVLINTEKEELLVAKPQFNLKNFNQNYEIEITPVFDKLANKELLILTVLHCINYYYYMSLVA